MKAYLTTPTVTGTSLCCVDPPASVAITAENDFRATYQPGKGEANDCADGYEDYFMAQGTLGVKAVHPALCKADGVADTASAASLRIVVYDLEVVNMRVAQVDGDVNKVAQSGFYVSCKACLDWDWWNEFYAMERTFKDKSRIE